MAAAAAPTRTLIPHRHEEASGTGIGSSQRLNKSVGQDRSGDHGNTLVSPWLYYFYILVELSAGGECV